MKVSLDALHAAKRKLVEVMDFEGAAHVRDAIVALGGTCDPLPDPPSSPPPEPMGTPCGIGVILPDPAIEGCFAIIAYLPDEDRFAVYRGAMPDGDITKAEG